MGLIFTASEGDKESAIRNQTNFFKCFREKGEGTHHKAQLSYDKFREVRGLNFFDSFASKKYMSTQNLFLSGSVLGVTVPNAAIQTGQGASR